MFAALVVFAAFDLFDHLLEIMQGCYLGITEFGAIQFCLFNQNFQRF